MATFERLIHSIQESSPMRESIYYFGWRIIIISEESHDQDSKRNLIWEEFNMAGEPQYGRSLIKEYNIGGDLI